MMARSAERLRRAHSIHRSRLKQMPLQQMCSRMILQ